MQSTHNLQEHPFTAPEPIDSVVSSQEQLAVGTSQGQRNNIDAVSDVDAFLDDSIVVPLQKPVIQEGYHTPHTHFANTSNSRRHLSPTQNSQQWKSDRLAKKKKKQH